ncbi:hypothetical protein [Arcticibacterium luteifluviistationis]|uniref:Anti-sigma factor n=1 Tax=Arcticibacterium luteifluviistationis TaxID=1784714 RepID=A0A2Z4G9I8_9BACT|nr:hypothetical protein [Arcticibacterium luteifluviistationis]AWV97892.1 hypothetical protein DJ013_06810 [Arcticibacterium luteifluviistationis]
MDKLKNYISENREAFDTHEPSADLWLKIDQELSTPSLAKEIAFKPKKWFNWQIAASVVLLLSIGFLAGKYFNPVTENKEIINLSSKYGSEVIQYASFIEKKKKQLNSYAESAPELMLDFNEDLEALNGSFEALKNDLPNNPNQEEILDRMIDNLEWQMQLLDQQLDIIKEKTKEEKPEIVFSPNENKEDMPASLV